MDKYTIGNNAGIVWKLLNNGKRWSYEDLKKASGLTDRDLNAAIGWLAREDKVYFETDKNNTEFLYLSVDVAGKKEQMRRTGTRFPFRRFSFSPGLRLNKTVFLMRSDKSSIFKLEKRKQETP